jgi:predicted transcriptional regulator
MTGCMLSELRPEEYKLLKLLTTQGGTGGPTTLAYPMGMSWQKVSRVAYSLKTMGLVRITKTGKQTNYDITMDGRGYVR